MATYMVYDDETYYPSAEYFSSLKKAREHVQLLGDDKRITIARVIESNYEYEITR